MKTFSPTLVPDKTFASSTYVPILVIINYVPLHNPKFWSILLNNITSAPTFNLSLWDGSPEVVIVFRNSEVCMSSGPPVLGLLLHGESQLKYIFSSPWIRSKT